MKSTSKKHFKTFLDFMSSNWGILIVDAIAWMITKIVMYKRTKLKQT